MPGILYVIPIVGMLGCAVLAVRAARLLPAALWLAGVSVFTAILLYLIGATLMAVIELSLSVGLITILLVFAISMVGANAPDQPFPRSMNVPLVLAFLLLVLGLTVPYLSTQAGVPEPDFRTLFWEQRQSDLFAQIALIFSGVLGVLGLLAEPRRYQVIPPTLREQADTAILPDAVPETELERV